MACGEHCACPECAAGHPPALESLRDPLRQEPLDPARIELHDPGRAELQDPGIDALAWGFRVAESKPGQSSFWSIAEAIDYHDRARAELSRDDAAPNKWVRDLAYINAATAASASSTVRWEVATLAAAIRPRISSPEGIEKVVENVIGFILSDRLRYVVEALRRKLNEAHGVLITLLLLDPNLLLIILGLGGFVALLVWLLDTLIPIVGPPWAPERKCCPEKIELGLTKKLGKGTDEDPCSPNMRMKVTATWKPQPEPCDCECCEVRQFVSSTMYVTRSGGQEKRASVAPEEYPRPPYDLTASSLEAMILTDDPWMVHNIDGEYWMEDHRFANQRSEDGNTVDPGFGPQDIEGSVKLKRAGASAKQIYGPRMMRYGLPGEGGDDPCKYTYIDEPGYDGPGCASPGMKSRIVFNFVMVIRPKPGTDCHGDPMVKRCSFEIGCEWVGENSGWSKHTPQWDWETMTQVDKVEPSPCRPFARVSPSCGED